jgi:hypothetical protein
MQQACEFTVGLTRGLLCCAADAVDLYIATTGTLRIVDFNPICPTTSPLLFSWDELPYPYMKRAHAGTSDASGAQAVGEGCPTADTCSPDRDSNICGAGIAPVIRVVEDAGRVRPGTRVVTGMPFDMLDMQASVEEVLEKAQLVSAADPQ